MGAEISAEGENSAGAYNCAGTLNSAGAENSDWKKTVLGLRKVPEMSAGWREQCCY